MRVLVGMSLTMVLSPKTSSQRPSHMKRSRQIRVCHVGERSLKNFSPMSETMVETCRRFWRDPFAAAPDHPGTPFFQHTAQLGRRIQTAQSGSIRPATEHWRRLSQSWLNHELLVSNIQTLNHDRWFLRHAPMAC